jgi:hypothetical protein
MSDPLLVFLIKLPLALAVFLLIAYAGTISQRIAGVLFTFPILNGVAIITSPDPVAVAEAIYPLVIFNCALFAIVTSFPHALPPVSMALPPAARLILRVIAWSAAWLIGALALTSFHEALPGGAVLLAGAAIFALAFMAACWSPQARAGRAASRADFVSFWGNRVGLWRIAFFCLTYVALVLVAGHALDQKWVGMASALPLPGFFALGTLIDAADGADVRAIRDTLFLGPLLVIPFNWTFSHLLAFVPAPALAYILLFAWWAIAAVAVIVMVPRIAVFLDARRS